MLWLKRNLFLAGWGVVALGLMAVAFYFLFSVRSQHDAVSGQLNQATVELQRLYQSEPYPESKNVQAIKQQQQQVADLLLEVKKHIPPPPAGRMDTASFKKLVDDSVFKLKREAEAARVTLPPGWDFTFTVQRKAMRFAPGTIEPLVARLEEIKALCAVLFQARVPSLDSLRRVAVSADELESGSYDYLTQSVVTNPLTGLVSVPYEVAFTGFSAELATVLDGLVKASKFVIVKNIAVEPAPAVTNLPPVGVAVRYVAPPPPPSDNPDEETEKPVPVFLPPGAPAASRSGLITLLHPQLLHITLLLDVVAPPAVK